MMWDQDMPHKTNGPPSIVNLPGWQHDSPERCRFGCRLRRCGALSCWGDKQHMQSLTEQRFQSHDGSRRLASKIGIGPGSSKCRST